EDVDPRVDAFRRGPVEVTEELVEGGAEALCLVVCRKDNRQGTEAGLRPQAGLGGRRHRRGVYRRMLAHLETSATLGRHAGVREPIPGLSRAAVRAWLADDRRRSRAHHD